MTGIDKKNIRGTHEPHDRSVRQELFIVVFGTHTRAGKLFDLALLWLIILSVLIVLLESIPNLTYNITHALRIAEWVVTILFTIEYVLRIWIVKSPQKYILSWYGIIDLLSILPTYLSIFLVGSQGLAVIRALRLLRVFRILKLMQFVSEARTLGRALRASRHKITVFFLFLIVLVFILGSIMYLVEGGESGFHSIPQSIYWAIVTLTTVGYGDVTPVTVVGKMISSLVMLIGYSIIAIPTGIVGAEIYREVDDVRKRGNRICENCGAEGHERNASFCKNCGNRLTEQD